MHLGSFRYIGGHVCTHAPFEYATDLYGIDSYTGFATLIRSSPRADITLRAQTNRHIFKVRRIVQPQFGLRSTDSKAHLRTKVELVHNLESSENLFWELHHLWSLQIDGRSREKWWAALIRNQAAGMDIERMFERSKESKHLHAETAFTCSVLIYPLGTILFMVKPQAQCDTNGRLARGASCELSRSHCNGSC